MTVRIAAVSQQPELARRMRAAALRWVLPILIAVGPLAAAAATDPEVLSPVPVVQDGRLDVSTDRGQGAVPIHTSRDWTVPQPDVARAIIMVHGWPRRDLRSGERAAARAGAAAQDAIIITPQFLIPADITAHQLPERVLRWGTDDWKIGLNAQGPAPISSFDVLDAILARLADRRLFPHLGMVVIAGHSAGGQFVQRYAVIGHGQDPLLQLGVHLRYVVANPSSYLYVTPDRPVALSSAPGSTAGRCPRVDSWEFGLGGGLPQYASRPVDPDALRRGYLARDVVYLLGTADNDPNHHQLDRSCAAAAQGSTRLARGINYFASLAPDQGSAPGHRLMEVPGIGHSSSQMFSSDCGLAALFDLGHCTETPPGVATPAAQPR